MIYTKGQLDVTQVEDKEYLNKLLAIGEELNDHYRNRKGPLNFDKKEDVKLYKKYDKERKEIERKGDRVYDTYVDQILKTVSPKGITEEQSRVIWNYVVKERGYATMQGKVDEYLNICQVFKECQEKLFI